MAMRKWSVIEDDIKKDRNVGPNLLRYLGEVHERLREQHQQIMQVAEYISKQSDMMMEMIQGNKSLMGKLDKLGLKEQLQELEGDPGEEGSTYHTMRDEPGKKN